MGKNINRLKVLRAEQRKSQLDVAIAGGFKEYRYWRIENGYIDPTPEERAALAGVFKVGVGEVFPEVVAS